MTTVHPRTKRILAGVILGSCALGIAAPAFAYDDYNPGRKDPAVDFQTLIAKADSETGAPLGGAVYDLTVSVPRQVYVGVNPGSNATADGYTYDRIADPMTWGYESRVVDIDDLDPTVDEWVAETVARTNTQRASMDAGRAEALSGWADFDAAHAQSVVDAWNAFDEEHGISALQADVTAKSAERQRLADEIFALQEQGQPVPAELAVAHATARDAAAAAAQTLQDALGEDGFALQNDAATSAAALERYNADVTRANSIYGLPLPQITADDVDTASYWTTAAYFENQGVQADRALKQAQCNIAAGLTNVPVSAATTDGRTTSVTYRVASCPDGTIVTPVATSLISAVEVQAPAGYVLDETVYTTAYDRVTDERSFNGLSVAVVGGTQDFSAAPLLNAPTDTPPVEPEEPTEPEEPVVPVEPEEPVTPEEPAVEEPVEPTPETPASETLAQTGGSTSIALVAGAIGTALTALGGVLLAARKRRA